MSRSEAWVWVVLRGFVFVPGACLAVGFFFVLGYSGFNAVLVFAPLLLLPVTVVCWVQASAGKGGDRWTLGYTAFWVLVLVSARLGSWVF